MTTGGSLRLPPVVRAVLLDLDGTLSESGPSIAAAVSVALAHVGLDPLDETALQALVGPPLEDSFAAMGMAPATVAEAVRVYRANYDLLSSPVYPGVADLLEALTAAGLPLAVATSKPQPFAEVVVDGTLPRGTLPVVVGSDRDAGRVTKGDVVAEALRRLGSPTDAVMVGDRSHDVLGAAEHGLPCIGVLWGYGSEQELLHAGAAAVVGSVAELRALLLPG